MVKNSRLIFLSCLFLNNPEVLWRTLETTTHTPALAVKAEYLCANEERQLQVKKDREEVEI